MKKAVVSIILILLSFVYSCTNTYEEENNILNASYKLTQQNAPEETSSGNQGGSSSSIYCRDQSDSGYVIHIKGDWFFAIDGGGIYPISYDVAMEFCGKN